MFGAVVAIAQTAKAVPVLLECCGYESAGLAMFNGATLIKTPIDTPKQYGYDFIIRAVVCAQFKIRALGKIWHVLCNLKSAVVRFRRPALVNL